MRDGSYWMAKEVGEGQTLADVLAKVVQTMALKRYEGVPDVEERVGEAYLALVEAAAEFEPKPRRDRLGYFLRFVLGRVAGWLRNGAQRAKDTEPTLTGIMPEDLGIEYVYEAYTDAPDGQVESTLILNNGQAATTSEVVDLIAGHEERREIAAKLMGIQADDPEFRDLLRDAVYEVTFKSYSEDLAPEPEPANPVVEHELEDIEVVRNGEAEIIPGDKYRRMVERASRGGAVWEPEDWEVRYETPWPRDKAAEEGRAFQSAYADSGIWPEAVDRELWTRVMRAWEWVFDADDVLGALEGGVAPEWAEDAVRAMEDLAEALGDVDEHSTLTVARALARKLADMRIEVSREPAQSRREALAERIGWFLGADASYGYEYQMPRAASLLRRAKAWYAKVAQAKGVWPSQAAAIGALVLKGASPYEAQQVARKTYARTRATA